MPLLIRNGQWNAFSAFPTTPPRPFPLGHRESPCAKEDAALVILARNVETLNWYDVKGSARDVGLLEKLIFV
jgi:hypothetical protein